MKRNAFFKSTCLAVAAATTTACFASCGSGNYAQNNEEYFIGASGPLTGNAAVYGTAVKNAAQMAVDEINAAGGLNGVRFRFEMLDDQNNATNVAANYADLYEKGMQCSLGCVTTKPCLEFKGYAVTDELFTLCPSASGDDVAKDADNVFQMCFTDSGQGAEAARYVKENFANEKSTLKIGVLYKAGDDYSEGLYKNFKAEMGDNWGGYNVTTASFTDETNFSSQVQVLENCTFFVMPIYYSPASTFMLTAKGKVANDAVYFGFDGFDGIDSIAGFNLNDIPQEVSMLSHFNSKATEGAAKEFAEKYAAKYTSAADKGTLNQFGAAAYDCVYAVYEAMQTAIENGKEIPVNIAPEDLNAILKEVFLSETFTFNGATGTNIRWNEDGTVNKSAVKYILKNVG